MMGPPTEPPNCCCWWMGWVSRKGVAVVVQSLELAVGIERVQAGIAEVVEEIAVEVVGAGLGDGVDLTAGGLAEFDGVVGGLGLELLDGVERVDVGGTGGAAARLREEHLVVVGAVDVVLVVEAADAVEADEAGAAVLGDVGGEEDEGAPVAAGDGKIGDELLVDGLGDFGLLGVDERGFAGDDDLGGDGGGRKGDVDGEDLADGEDEVLAVDLAEAAAAER